MAEGKKIVQIPSDSHVTHVGGMKISVVHYKDPDAEDPPPRWDTTAVRKNPPPPSREKIKRVLQEEAQRMAFQAKRVHAYCKEKWDSERPQGLPTGELPYFELEWAASAKAEKRHGFEYDTSVVPLMPSEIRAVRTDRCVERGWMSGNDRPYETLGEVPLLPSMVKPGQRPKPLKIHGDVYRPPSEGKGENDIRKLKPDVGRDGAVPKGELRYFSCNVPEGKNLTIELFAYAGDPDLFVSTHHHRPNADRHTWRSNTTDETEILEILSDDPMALEGGGEYFIGVFGEKQSDFRITVRYWRQQIFLPPKPKRIQTRGYLTIGKELRRSASRLRATSSGSAPAGSGLTDAVGSLATPIEVPVEALADEDEEVVVAPVMPTPSARRGGPKGARTFVPPAPAAPAPDEAAVLRSHVAAGRPAARVLRAHSEYALHGAPRVATQLSLSRSLENLPLRGLVVGAAEDDEEEDDGGGEAGGEGLRASFSGVSLASSRASTAPASAKRSPGRGVGWRDPTLDLRWQPPEGHSWADLESGSRLMQALNECIEVRTGSRAGRTWGGRVAGAGLAQTWRCGSLARRLMAGG